MRRASRSITSRDAPTKGARSILLITSRSERVMPGPPLRGILSPPATSITWIETSSGSGSRRLPGYRRRSLRRSPRRRGRCARDRRADLIPKQMHCIVGDVWWMCAWSAGGKKRAVCRRPVRVAILVNVQLTGAKIDGQAQAAKKVQPQQPINSTAWW
jgi:hypothetical protein